jgi:riboflavin biosynthesis pyrimidine reductase
MLPMYDYPLEAIKLTPCYANEKLMAQWRSTAPEKVVPKKVLEAYGEVYFPPAPEMRPYTFQSMVLSLDGRIGFSDQALGPLIAKGNKLDPDGGMMDFWVLNMLRMYADATILGARTLQVEEEGYAWICDADLVEARRDVLKKNNAMPINIIVSYDGTDIPLDHATFKCKEIEVWIATSPQGGEYLKENAPFPVKIIEPGAPAIPDEVVPVIVTGQDNMTDTTSLLAALRSWGIQRLLIESPTFAWHLLHEGQMDEVFWNYSGVMAGGPITIGRSPNFTLDSHPHCELVYLARHRSSFIFTRQKLHYDL